MQTIIILPIAIAGIVIMVKNSIALAFSLAGIVAAVRFRNSLKDTSDALYIFGAIGVGLAAGIGALSIAAVISVFFCYAILFLWRCDYGVCPVNGPRAEYSSGLLIEKMRSDKVAAEKGKKKDKKKEKGKGKKKHKGGKGEPETVEVTAESSDRVSGLFGAGRNAPR